MAKIYLIHPIDENLQFLYKIVKNLSRDFPGKIEYLKLSNNPESHRSCLSIISKACRQDVLCFLCHGRSDGLLGCRFRADYPAHRRKYEHGLLIDQNNISLLQNKKIFCLACDSNKVAQLAVAAGVEVFVGFDDINLNTTKDANVRANAKYSLREAVYYTLKHGIQNKLSFYELADYLKLFIDKQNDALILGHKGHRGYQYYFQTANVMQEIKEGIVVRGDGTLPFGG